MEPKIIRPKGLSVVLELGKWYVGIDFRRDHSYIAIGWLSLHFYTFAFLEYVSDYSGAVNAMLAEWLEDNRTDLWGA